MDDAQVVVIKHSQLGIVLKRRAAVEELDRLPIIAPRVLEIALQKQSRRLLHTTCRVRITHG
jgi:hypothetical protein